MIQFSPGFAENIRYSDIRMSHINQSQTDAKPQKQSSTKNSNFSASGSSSNANNNGVYVDLGKALLEAAKCGDTEKVQECIKNGAPFITDWLGTSALHASAKNNYYETCATLLRSGISKDSKTKVDRTPLHFAVFEGNFEICQLLIQYECSIDSLDMLKMTPLHWAIEKGFDNIAELLIENGANPHIMSKFLKTPYLIAKEKNNDLIVNLIEMLPTTPCTPLSQYESSVFASLKTSTPTTTSVKVKDETTMMSEHRPATTSTYKRERFHSYDSADTTKRLKLKNSTVAAATAAIQNDAKNLTLQLLKEQMSMMTSAAEDNLIQSALQSGRKIMLSEAGRRLLNDSNLNKFLKIPLNTTISSTPSPSSSCSSSSTNQKSVSPRSTATTKSMTMPRRTSDSSAADILEIFRETGSQQHKTASADILNMIKSTNELQEVTITQRSSSSKVSPLSSPKQKTGGVSLSAINVNVPKAKAQQQLMKIKNSTQLPSSTDVINNSSPDFRSKFHNNIISTNNNNNHITRDDGGGNDETKAETIERKYSELFNNFQQLKKSFEREKQKNEKMQLQLTQLQSNFETYKQQQNSIIQVLLQQHQQSSSGNEILIKNKNNNNYEMDDDDASNVL
ncbi:hypothetical protein PVAND_007818 [Polypedilum vanderplanki]|uniref:Uncharacterized protein n=1 Tax=Polypedilum vanderplanki TaxID=319348 RepID=A0A9J6C831_POLVA|nr:hypothetical protein PVAND_007818 [Polypedilum vanderplanki]